MVYVVASLHCVCGIPHFQDIVSLDLYASADPPFPVKRLVGLCGDIKYMDVDTRVSHCMNSKGAPSEKSAISTPPGVPDVTSLFSQAYIGLFKVIAIILTIFENLKWNTRSLSLSKENYGCLLQFFSFFSFLILPLNTSYFSQ